jgi:SAM-dependent methyltransferase
MIQEAPVEVNYERIAKIIEELHPLDEYQAYYVKDTVRCERIGPLVPPIPAILRSAMGSCPRILDVGCGNGHTLLDNADAFERGIGLDDSEYMLTTATTARKARGIRNVEFTYGKAIALPLDSASFDLVFSQRGPLGHHDGTLVEALRVLRPGGLILVETGGGFGTLQTEKARFEGQGVEIQLAATFAEKLVFPDCYEFFRHYCVSWCSYEAARAMRATDRATVDKILADATDTDGSPCFRWSRILIGGRKVKDQPATYSRARTA